MTRPLLTIAQARQLLNVSDSTMRALIKRGQVRAARIGGLWRIDQDDLEAFVAASGTRPATTRVAAVEGSRDADRQFAHASNRFA